MFIDPFVSSKLSDTVIFQLKQPTMDQITENVHYKILLTHASMLDGHLGENRANFTKLSEELRLLQATRQEWEESVTVCYYIPSGLSLILIVNITIF